MSRSGTDLGIHGEVKDVSEDARGGPGRVVGTSGRCGMGRGTLEAVRDGLWENPGRSGTGRGTHPEVRDGPADSRRGPGRVGGATQRSGMRRRTLGVVRDRSGDPPEFPGRDGEPSGRCEMGWRTLEEVRNGTADPRGGP